MLTLANHLSHIGGRNTRERSSGPDLRYTLLLWEKATRRLEKTYYVTRAHVVLCCAFSAMATAAGRIKGASAISVHQKYVF